MKSFTKLALTALTIAVGFTACTKDNSVAPTATPSVKFSSKATSSSLRLRDTIQPQVRTKLVSPTVSRDTIQPK